MGFVGMSFLEKPISRMLLYMVPTRKVSQRAIIAVDSDN
jgi:hypothetical protein